MKIIKKFEWRQLWKDLFLYKLHLSNSQYTNFSVHFLLIPLISIDNLTSSSDMHLMVKLYWISQNVGTVCVGQKSKIWLDRANQAGCSGRSYLSVTCDEVAHGIKYGGVSEFILIQRTYQDLGINFYNFQSLKIS